MAALRLGHRAAIMSRILAAILGGYALASATAVVLAVALPFSRVDATLSGMMVGTALYAGAAVWSFAVRSATRAWAGVLGATLLLAAAALVLRPDQLSGLLP